MTNSEFKAWFEGYTESIEDAPSEKQWKRIKARVKEIDGHAVSYPVFVDRYWPTVTPYWRYANGIGPSGIMNCSVSTSGQTNMQNSLQGSQATNNFDSHQAIYAAGRAEATQ